MRGRIKGCGDEEGGVESGAQAGVSPGGWDCLLAYTGGADVPDWIHGGATGGFGCLARDGQGKKIDIDNFAQPKFVSFDQKETPINAFWAGFIEVF